MHANVKLCGAANAFWREVAFDTALWTKQREICKTAKHKANIIIIIIIIIMIIIFFFFFFFLIMIIIFICQVKLKIDYIKKMSS